MMKKITLVFTMILVLIGCMVIEEDIQVKDEVVIEIVIPGKRGDQIHSYKGEMDPFQNSQTPVPVGYMGTAFDLKHDYPAQLPTDKNFPWKTVTNHGKITQKNANDYVLALKKYVSTDAHKMLFHYDKWKADKEDWWQSIWLGTQREPIHGTYVGSKFNSHTLANQNINLTTFVYTMYDKRAAVTLNRIWSTNRHGAENPNLTSAKAAQYAEGSVIVKFAFVTASGDEWSAMKGAAPWTVFSNVDPSTGSSYSNKGSVLRDVYLMQFDIIVKDSQAAPKTGWVFSTLVYDKNAPGKDAWDRMIPLGATWGNNPEIINTKTTAIIPPVEVNQNLTQNWINMKTPDYARSTLGWDGRLSGPNDGAVVSSAKTKNGKEYPNLTTVGCLGCHSSAQYQQKDFLLPAVKIPSKAVPFVLYDPGSEGWMKWFQDRNGKTPMDHGPQQIGLDYGMVTSFKAIPMWQEAMKIKKKNKK